MDIAKTKRMYSAWGLVLLVIGALSALAFKVYNAGNGSWYGLDPIDFGVIAFAVLYSAMVVTIRWQMIAEPIHSQMEVRLLAIQVELERLGDTSNTKDIADLAEKAVELTKNSSALDVLFWSRGRETSGWLLIDAAEQRMVDFWHRDRLIVRLAALEQELSSLGAPGAKGLSKQLSKLHVHADEQQCTVEELRELYVQGLMIQRNLLRKDDLDVDYHNNKLAWYIVISLLAIVLIANILPQVSDSWNGRQADFLTWLVGGAIGGVLSRVTRAVRSSHATHELGLRWLALFLSPLLGALAGWAGIVLIEMAKSSGILNIDFGSDQGFSQLGLAILLGVSERFFTDLAGQVEGRVKGDASVKEDVEPGA